MTTNHHTPISVGAPANAATFNSPLGQLDSAIDTALTTANDLKSGIDGFTQLSLSTTTTLTISSGVITATRSRHLVDTEASATYDDLDTINGGVAGDVLVLQSVTSARVVVVKHGTGNIFLNGYDVHLDNPRKTLTLLHDGTRWVLVGAPPQRINRRQMRVLFNEGTSILAGHAPIYSFGTPTSVGEVNGIHTLYTSAATAVSNAGVQSGSALTQPRYNPSFTIWLRTSSNISSIRWYIGFNTGTIYAAGDNLPSTGVSGVVFRYSTIAGDAGFRPVTSNGTTQTVHAQLGANLAINTAYRLQISIVNGVAYFSVNDSSYFSTALTMPAPTTGLLWTAHLQTQENVAKAVAYRQIFVETE